MAIPLEGYALIGDMQTAALVSREGSIDWLCLPRFDAGACFAALLGERGNGRWLLAPQSAAPDVRRRYRDDSLVLETEFVTPEGSVRIVDFMPPRHGADPEVVRIVEGVSGRVPMRMELIVRFDYGRGVPWVRRGDGRLFMVGGPDALVLDTPVATHGEGLTTIAEFTVEAGDSLPFGLEWHPSHLEWRGRRRNLAAELAQTTRWWTAWAAQATYQGPWRDAVIRSLITLKALTFEPTGGIVAAPTTSLPEEIGGMRNWDYRFCWLRDATMTLDALLAAGYEAEAVAWRDWLLRAVAGSPEQMQIMYGVAGERLLPEVELKWLPGYEQSAPVRIGNAAVDQLQLDVYGQVMDSAHEARRIGIESDEAAWSLQRALMESLETHWSDPDNGIWEVRGPRRHFTHSKVLAWVAADRAVKAVDRFKLDGPRDRWAGLRESIHAEVCAKGYDADRGTFTQYYGGHELDASLLVIPQVGFLPGSDERVAGTVAAIQRELCEDGLVYRYQTSRDVDGLPPGEGAFLACTFWLADAYARLGRRDVAIATFERILDLANDVGLLAEQYDPGAGRFVGNFPQAFSHVALVNAACILSRGQVGPAPSEDE